MEITIRVTKEDLTLVHIRLLRAGCSEYGTSVMTHDETTVRAAKELCAIGLMNDDGLLRPDYRHRMFSTTIVGRAFLRQEVDGG